MKQPFITVNIAVYNQLKNIPIILEAMSKQTFQDFEVIVTDDGSNDGTSEWMSENLHNYPFELSYYRQEKNGFRLAASKNMAINNARGQFFLCIEGDIVPHPLLLATYSQNARPNLILLGVRHEIKRLPTVDELDDLSDQVFSLDYRLETLRSWFKTRPEKPYMFASGCNLFIPTEPLRQIGGWDEEYRGYGKDDYDVVMRLFSRGMRVEPLISAFVYHIDHPHGHSPESDARFYAKEKEIFG